jgi:hypothetical protein
MTDRRGRGSEPDDLTHLSEEDVERRLDGGAGLGGPVERAPQAPPPPPRARSRRRTVLWRDAGLVLALLAILAVGARAVLPGEPAAAAATPSTAPSNVAVASLPPTSTPAPATPTPAVTGEPVPSDVIGSLIPEVSPTPIPTATPVPTPRPTQAPGATPTPRPTAGTATITVYLDVIVDDGGNKAPSNWTVNVSGANASPTTFKGTSSGKVVHVTAGKSYSITASGPSGYVKSPPPSTECAGKLAAGASAICTITENDSPASVVVTTVISSGSISPSDVTISVTAPHVTPPSATGSASGRPYFFDANALSYAVDPPIVPSGYVAVLTGSCSGAGPAEGGSRYCTATVDQQSSGFMIPPGGAITALAWLAALLRPRRPRA